MARAWRLAMYFICYPEAFQVHRAGLRMFGAHDWYVTCRIITLRPSRNSPRTEVLLTIVKAWAMATGIGNTRMADEADRVGREIFGNRAWASVCYAWMRQQ
ncbi:unnamed protein product [Cercospora beticola]|nr:unnamed protein product [Cercospora beticola]